jgi:XTP/dITP diphosphohydrolase
MPQILIASNNPGKLKEFMALLKDLNVKLLTPALIGMDNQVNEDGHTYAENALLKGEFYAQTSRMITLADDSGLEVDALKGLPGIYSARFAPQAGATDAERRAYLVHRLQGRPRPWLARFRCVLALVTPDGESRFTEGICQGEVICEELGVNGFGYDPIFLIPELGKTMAELTMAEKNRISHRARAVQKILPILTDLIRESV